MDVLKQKISHIEEVKDLFKVKVKEIKTKNKILPIKPFDFTEYLERKQQENEIHLGLFFDIAEKNKIVYNQVPVNNFIVDIEKVENGFLTSS